MRDSIHPARLTRSRRAHLLAVALPLSAVLVAGCTGGSGHPAPATARATASALSAAYDCVLPPAACYTPSQFRVAYGIQPLLDSGIDGRGETVTDLETAVPANGPPGSTIIQAGPTSTATIHVTGPPGQPPAVTDIRQDLARFDSLFRLPAARIQVVTSLARLSLALAGGEWRAGGWRGGRGPRGTAHGRPRRHPPGGPAASQRQGSAKGATAGMLTGLRLAVSGADVVSVSWDLGEHFFTKAQAAEMNSILQRAAAHHVTVVASSGDTGPFSDMQAFESTPSAPGGGTPVKEVSLPASDPFVLAVGGTTLTANPATGAYISETAWNTSTCFSQPGSASGGGFSHLYARPSYQDGVPGIGAMRGVPDVAGDADAQDGAPIVFAAAARHLSPRPPAPRPPRRCGRDSSRWPTSTLITTSASSTPPSTASPAAPATTRRFTTLLPVTTT